MRKKNLLSLACLSMALTIFAQPNAQSVGLQPTNDPYDLRYRVDYTKLTPQQRQEAAQNAVNIPEKKSGPKKIYKEGAASTTTTYLAVQQSMYSGYSFAYLSGDVLMWNVDVTIDGSTATISNLFDLDNPNDPYNSNLEYDIVGVYDDEAGTITVATPSEFVNATIVGSFYGMYPAVMFSGKVDETGKLVEVDTEVVFTIDKETNTITTDRHFGCSMYTADGSQSYGVQECFAKSIFTQQSEEANILVFTEAIDFGEAYIEYPITKTFQAVNIGSEAGDYVLSLEGDGFTVTPETGSIEPLATQIFTVTYEATEPNVEYEGIITLTTDNGDSLVQLLGTSIPYPDYSSIVLNGDISFKTGMEYPFVIDDTLVEGKSVARMSIPAGVRTYTQCYLLASFEVPENHIGTFSWKGLVTSTVGWNALGGIFIDDNPTADYVYQNVIDFDMSNTIQFGPGTHNVRFVWEAPYAGHENDKLYVYDLNFESTEAADAKVTLENNNIEFGNFIIEGSFVEGKQTIQLRNEGKQTLKVLSATSTENFSIAVPDTEVALMEYLPLEVSFNATGVGTFEGDIVITTTAGDITIHNHAFVREMPDFTQIVEEGDFIFETNPDNPYIVENGVAFNSTSKVIDNQPTTSYLKCSFVVPEGKLGILTWDAEASFLSSYDENYNNYNSESFYVIVNQPMNSYWWAEYQYDRSKPAEFDLSSDAFIAKSDEWTDYRQYTMFTPGDSDKNYLQFNFYQGGDGEYMGEDRLAVKNLKLVLIDFEDHAVETDIDSYDFNTIYTGQRSKGYITFTNIGSQNFEIYGVECDGPFNAEVSSVPVAFQKTVQVPIYFEPVDEGTFEAELVFDTSAGDVVIKCTGVAKSREGILLLEDFEDDAAKWTIIDNDGDGLYWDLASNLLGGEHEKFVHSGEQAIVSMSYNYNLGGLTPDNWVFSPEFTIPAEHDTDVMLTWWTAAQVGDEYIGDNYTVYISDKDATQEFNENDWTELYTEIVENVEWEQREVEISEYAGKTCRLAFRHHDCENHWMLKIDDVIVFDGTTGIKAIDNSNKNVVSQEFYTIDGLKINNPETGIYIVKTKYDDGTMAAKKAIFKK